MTSDKYKMKPRRYDLCRQYLYVREFLSIYKDLR